jgi:diguanylate cyclase (GGDEF)-like protein
MSDLHANKPRADAAQRGPAWRPDLGYAVALFLVAAVALGVMLQREGFLAGDYGWGSAVFFLAYGVFTITMGFPHPGFGHVSFDRVAQIAAILVLGPVDAAWISGLASLVYPWKRLLDGETVTTVATASLHNSGLMTLVVLICGLLYVAAGGPVPVTALDPKTIGLLLLLILSMQLVNDLGMLAMFRLRNQDPSKLLNLFTAAVELGSVLIGVLIAMVYVRLESTVLALLLIVLSIGMLVLKRYAEMRTRLEALVDERTEELRIKTRELERQATHDTLTGIYNRRFADDYLQREIERAQLAGRNFTIALADIDHFKQINDRFSHATGDIVLQRVASILSGESRSCVVARYGGEEFLLCFPDAGIEVAAQICSKLRAAVEVAQWSSIAEDVGADFVITLSFGIAQARPDSRSATLLGEADSRLYQAKNRGRNRVVAFDLPA